MKKCIAIISATLCTFIMFSIPVNAEPADKPADTKNGETESTPLKKTYPLPFSPLEDEEQKILKEIKGTEGATGDIQAVTIGGKDTVPLFDLQQSGMRFAIRALFFIAAPLALAVIVYSAVRLIVKTEAEEEAVKLRRTLIFSAIGLLIMSLAYALVQNVLKIFG